MGQVDQTARYGEREIPRLNRKERDEFQQLGEESRRYWDHFEGGDPNTLRSDPSRWKQVLTDIADRAPEKAERWGFGKMVRVPGYYYVKYYERKPVE